MRSRSFMPKTHTLVTDFMYVVHHKFYDKQFMACIFNQMEFLLAIYGLCMKSGNNLVEIIF